MVLYFYSRIFGLFFTITMAPMQQQVEIMQIMSSSFETFSTSVT
jgi:hypothetical protein